MKPNIVFIDSLINIDYLTGLKPDNVEIEEILTVDESGVKPSEPMCGSLSHASLCAKIFCDNVKSSCTLRFINIFDAESQNTNIKKLIIALKWCLENEINIINLSVGTTLLKDATDLYEIIDELIRNEIAIIAACSNDNKLTFPAFFEGVISVKATNNEMLINNPIFLMNRIDRVDAECYIPNEAIQYNNQLYKIYKSNSFAVPIITAKICDFMEQGYKINKEFCHNLMMRGNKKYLDCNIFEIREEYCKNISIPIIVIPYLLENNTSDIMKKVIMNLLKQFRSYGYDGICLSDSSSTNVPDLVFNLIEYFDFSLQDKIAFYSNYCKTNFLIVQINQTNFNELLSEKIFDIAVLDDNIDYDTSDGLSVIRKVYFSDTSNNTSLFNKLYSLLLN